MLGILHYGYTNYMKCNKLKQFFGQCAVEAVAKDKMKTREIISTLFSSEGRKYEKINIVILISSSNWHYFCIEALTAGSHRKYTKDNGQLLVAGNSLTLGVRGPGEKPSWGETCSSHPGQGS